MNKCVLCHSALPTSTEVKQGVCVRCVPSLLSKHQKLEEDFEKLRICKDEAEALLDRQETFREAESLGISAGARGSELSENPFQEQDPEHVFWDSGWLTGRIQKEFSKIMAVLRWSTDSLNHTIELAQGYGQEEIALKLTTVKEKLEDLIE